MSDVKAPESPTVPLPAMTDRAMLEELTRTTKALAGSVNAGFAEMRADIGLVSSDLTVVKDRLRIVEDWKGREEASSVRRSDAVRGVSSNDMKQDAAIASVVVKVTDLETATNAYAAKADANAVVLVELRDTVAKLAKNPVVVGLLTAAATAATAWLATKGH